jgi:hypothetical protein
MAVKTSPKERKMRTRQRKPVFGFFVHFWGIVLYGHHSYLITLCANKLRAPSLLESIQMTLQL